tara:strand:- start:766 stop:1260 length:495 start_codon:yes stop_codon:yes gene_type:complete
MKKIRTGGKVKRWHTVTTIQQQTVAEHSWGVAMICRKLWPEDKVLMEAALCHDLGEGLTGDVPWPVKQANFVFKKHLDEIEGDEQERLGCSVLLTSQQKSRLKVADMLEMICFAVEEIELGNKNMQEVFNRGLRFIDNPYMTTTDEQAIFEFTKPLVERAGESS